MSSSKSGLSSDWEIPSGHKESLAPCSNAPTQVHYQFTKRTSLNLQRMFSARQKHTRLSTQPASFGGISGPLPTPLFDLHFAEFKDVWYGGPRNKQFNEVSAMTLKPAIALGVAIMEGYEAAFLALRT
jgi:hypothetical protein